MVVTPNFIVRTSHLSCIITWLSQHITYQSDGLFNLYKLTSSILDVNINFCRFLIKRKEFLICLISREATFDSFNIVSRLHLSESFKLHEIITGNCCLRFLYSYDLTQNSGIAELHVPTYSRKMKGQVSLSGHFLSFFFNFSKFTFLLYHWTYLVPGHFLAKRFQICWN